MGWTANVGSSKDCLDDLRMTAVAQKLPLHTVAEWYVTAKQSGAGSKDIFLFLRPC